MKTVNKTTQKSVHFEADVLKALEKHMQKRGLNNFSVAVNDAVKFALFPEHREERNTSEQKVMQQMLYSLAEHRKKTARDLTVMQEMMMQFIQVYLMHAEEIPASDKTTHAAKAQNRMDEFMEELVRKLPKAKAVVEHN